MEPKPTEPLPKTETTKNPHLINKNIICLLTYGKEVKTDPQTNKKVSTIKCGQNAAASVLLALYGQNARDLSSSRSYYSYIALKPMPDLHHHYLTLQITASQLVTVEEVCKEHPQPLVFLWKNDKWWVFPSKGNTDYVHMPHSGPRITPNTTAIYQVQEQPNSVTPVTSFSPAPSPEAEPTEKQPLPVPHEMTYVAIATRGMEPNVYQENDKPMPALVCSENTSTLLSKLLGDRVHHIRSTVLNHYLSLDTIPALPDNYLLFHLSPDEVLLVEEICKQFNFARAFRWWLDTWWEFPGKVEPRYVSTKNLHQAIPQFNPEKHAQYALTTGGTPSPIPEPAAPQPSASGLILEKDRATWWIKGDTYPHRETLRAAGARWWRSGSCWYITGNLPESIQALIDPDNLSKLLPTIPALDKQKTPQMVQSPEAQHDHSSHTKETVHAQNTTARPAVPVSPALYQPPQVYLGSITGAAGDAFAFGAALGLDGTLLYLDLVGSKTAVESVWAQLDLGRMLKIISLEHRTEHALIGEKAGFKRFQRGLITGAEHLLILHKDVAETIYPDTAQTAIFYPDHAQAVARLIYHLTQLVTVPIFPEWHDYLWRLGEQHRLIMPCKCLGVTKPYCYRLLLSAKRWTEIICAGLKTKTICLPA